ncbi:MAG: DUF2255 family protein [Cellulomonas sp.]|nr:DUF2255 family protein [Cellulomonas sp.]
MSAWTAQAARTLADPQEIQVSTRRPDGTLRSPTTIWIVRDGERVFIRSTNGRTAAWFRGAIATGAGQITASRQTHDVTFTEVSGSDLNQIDAAYRAKYGRYSSIVDHLEGDEPRSATLEVHPV